MILSRFIYINHEDRVKKKKKYQFEISNISRHKSSLRKSVRKTSEAFPVTLQKLSRLQGPDKIFEKIDLEKMYNVEI